MKTQRLNGATFGDVLKIPDTVLNAGEYRATFGTKIENNFELWQGNDMIAFAEEEATLAGKLLSILASGVKQE